MNNEIKEAIMYLEHTTKDDFNLEKHQAENRIWAIKTLIEELQRKDNIINELKEWLNYSINIINEKLKNDNEEIIVKDGTIMNMNGYQILRLKTFRTKMKEVLDKIKELEGDNK